MALISALKATALSKTAKTVNLWGAVALLGVGVVGAQVVKAPRYTGAVDEPTPQLVLPAPPTAYTKGGTVVEDVVARVNDQIITRSDVERSEQEMMNEAKQDNLSPEGLAARQRDLLRDMIDQQLLLSKAKELGLNADADVIRQLDDIRKQNHLDSMEDLEKAAKQQGVSFEDFKAKIRSQILTRQVVQDEVGRKLQMSQADETKYYQDHLSEFQQPEQVRLSEILIPLPETATAEQIAQAEKKADDVKSQLMKNGNFADLAKKYSGGPTAAQGGELGLFKRGALAKVLEDETFDLKPGESTQPTRTRQGFVILKVTEHDAAGPAPMKDVEPQIQEALYIDAMQPALRAYLTKLREDSYVDIQPGFVDSGASAKETKPVFTAYAPPPVKKTKAPKDKARFDRGGARYATVAAAAPKEVVAGPDTTGGRTLTGSEAQEKIDPTTGLAVLTAPTAAKTNSNGSTKVAKVKREKIRFGQPPRNTLPGGSDDAPVVATSAGDPGTLSAGSQGTTAGSQAPANPVLGSISSDTPGGTNTVGGDTNPLDGPAPARTKSRFASKEVQAKAQKVVKVSAKKEEKIKATPGAATTEEKEAATVQDAPLGLGGDTSKKVKPARVPGAPKERLEDKKPASTQAAPVDQTASPLLAPTADTPASKRTSVPATQNPNNSPTPVQPTSQTTLPPVTQPVPGSSTQGQPILQQPPQ